MQPMKLNNIQTGFKRILLTVAAVFMLGNGWAQDAKVLKGRIVNAEGEPIASAVVNVAEASRIALSDKDGFFTCLLYTSPSPRDVEESRMPSSA